MNANNVIQNLPEVRSVSTGYGPGREPAGSVPVLKDDVIDIWSAQYADLDLHFPVLSSLITGDERKKATRFRRPEDARRWILRHGYLRLLLSYYLQRDPALLPLTKGAYGKPCLDSRGESSRISFNLSHTGERVALAVTKNYDIGIDLVYPDNRYPFRDTTAFLFNNEERAAIAKTQPDLQYHQFFRIWALKEALLKATGGSVMMMRDIDVSGIAQEVPLNNWYSIRYRHAEQAFFIHECGCENGHQYTIAAGLIS